MLDPMASRFGQAAILSGLMDVESVKACWAAIPPEKREAPEHIDRRLARQAVQSKALTLWQAQQILAGRTNGFKVDRYILLELIGQGGMGRVYLARDTRLNRRVALKILSPERLSNPRAVARFEREARVGAQLQHENLVRVYDFGESGGRFFLVMEFIEGRTIGSLLSDQGPMPPATAARLARQVAMGLAHADRKGLIHRDVNPYNIMVTHDGVAKLADLGLAKEVSKNDRVTRDGATVGTFDYVAPEQARHSHSADIRSDIYSLGCSLYHMLTGQVPFPSPSLPEKLFSHQAMEPTPVEHFVAGLPAGLGDVVRTMMRKQPEDRYSSPMQVAQALEPFIDEGANLRAEPSRAPGDATSRPGGAGRGSSARSSGDGAVTPTSAADLSPLPEGGPGPNGPQPDRDRGMAARVATAVPAGRGAAAVAGTPSPGSADAEPQGLPLLTPSDDVPEMGPGVPFVVDLGPEPPLRSLAHRPKPTSSTRLASFFSRPSSSEAAAAGTSRSWSSWRDLPPWAQVAIPAAIVIILGIALVAAAGKLTLFRGGSSAPDSTPHTPVNPGGVRGSRTAEARRPPPEIVVGTEGAGPGEETRVATLGEALKAAMGRGKSGYVELRNRTPLMVAPNVFPELASGSGTLVIRGAPGYHPVLSITMDGKSPWLATGTAVELKLIGVRIRVRYKISEGSRSAELAPLIHAAGPVQLDRCIVEVVGPRPENARAVSTEGANLTIDRCLLLGFDQPIRIKSFEATTARIRQTMIVAGPGAGAGTGTLPELRGWALGVQFQSARDPKSAAKRRLTLEKCTIEGAGLLDVGGDPGPVPLTMDVRHCAVRAEALLAWQPRRPGDRFGADVRWQGSGNQLDILGNGWIMGSAATMTPALTLGVTDRESWSRFVVGEADPVRPRIRFLTDIEKRGASPGPDDFAIESSDPPEDRAGAEPLQVGPEGR